MIHFIIISNLSPVRVKWPFRLCLSLKIVCIGPTADMTTTHVVHIHHLYLNSLAMLTTEDTRSYYDFLDIISLVCVQKTAMRMSM